MKSMEEIVGSLKDSKLRSFAIGLQEKLNNAKNAIMKKNKMGKPVSDEVNAQLKNSVVKYTEKNRSSIPQKVAMLLATSMLVSMLASCDNQVGQNNEDQPSKDLLTLEEVLAGEVPSAPVYDNPIVVDNDKIAEFNPDECGLNVFDDFNFENLAGDPAVTEDLKNKYLEIYSNAHDYEAPDIIASSTILFSDIIYRPSAANVKFRMDIVDFDAWKHELVFTENDFVLVSVDSLGNRYLTGFVDGTFKNEAGFVEESAIEKLKQDTQGKAYNEVLIGAKSNFFAQVIELKRHGKTNIGIKMSETHNTDGTFKRLDEVAYNFYAIGICSVEEIKDLAFIYNEGQILHDYVKIEENGGNSEDNESSAD